MSARRWLTGLLAAGILLAIAAPSSAADAPPPTQPTTPSSTSTVAPAPAPSSGSSTSSTPTTVSRATLAPLVLVVDLSSSMTEDDGTGTVRLDGAKAALTEVVRRQPVGTSVGMWTYPSSTGTCSPGGWVPGAGLGSSASSSDLLAQIRGLEAYGDTPTGPALEAVAESLRARGTLEATIMLVSDGESNCGVPACEVAQGIVDSGFDLTVMALGFQVSDGGRQELECIAEATAGEYVDVADSVALQEALDEFSVPQLTLEVQTVDSVHAGSGLAVTVVVTNPSATDVPDVQVSLSARDEGKGSVFPAVVPPRFRLGNLPAGESVTRRWDLTTALDVSGTIHLRIATWSSAVGASWVERDVVVRGEPLGLADAGPLLQEALANGPLLILGDSYSSGEGSGDYLDLGSDARDGCHVSYNTYGVSLAGPESTSIFACSGAVTVDLLHPNIGRDAPAQLSEVAALPLEPGLVLVTLGGNDIGFAGIVEACVKLGNCSEDTALTSRAFTSVAQLQPTLERSLTMIDRVVNSRSAVEERGAVAPIVLLAYPQVLPHHQGAYCMGFLTNEIRFANDLQRRLTTTASLAVANLEADGRPIYFAEATHDAMQPRHTACDDDPYVNPVDLAKGIGSKVGWVDGQELLHPNTSGYRAVTNALVAWSQTPAADLDGEGLDVAAPILTASEPVVSIDITGSSSTSITVNPGDGVEVTIRDLEPGSSVVITLHSTPLTIGSLRAGDDGVATGVVNVPGDTEPGQHQIVASGFGPEMEIVMLSVPLRVEASLPPIAPGLLGVAGVLLVAALLLGGFGIRTLRRPAAADGVLR